MTYNITDKNSDILDLLLEAKEQGISIFLEDGRVRLKVNEGVELSETFLKHLKEEKERIKQFLESEAGKYKENSYVKNEIKPYDRSVHTKIPLSFEQERLWFIDKLQGSIAYHISGVLRIKGALDMAMLSESAKILVNRHESLRTVFKDEEGIGYQHIMPCDEFKVTYITELEEETALGDYIEEIVATPFDLENDYMLRMTVVKESESVHTIIIVLHHIASDGWSTPIFVEELETCYQSLLKGEKIELAPLPIQYADYSIWQREYLSGAVLKQKLAYWEHKLNNTAKLELPIDFVRPAEQSFAGAMHYMQLSKEITTALNQLSQDNGTTMFMTLLSIYKILL